MNNFLRILNPKKSNAVNVKAKRGNGFFLEAVDDEESSPTATHTETTVDASAIVTAQPASITPTQTNESAIVVAETASIAPAKPAKTKKFKGGLAALVPGQGNKESATVVDTVATVVTAAPKTEPTPANFAPTYLSPALSQTPRRRPGPSMSSFMEMAQQVKVQ
ncbi:MAG: hypothetical protein NZ772_04535 [Cyanobacteria bacterium]|nr:hypothetical protein [Cyanobacteriota bacterium]MDW8200681.1 hypothetical protein [Cyanobacteriota bacterium SKYGB_h_bin112]